MKNIIYLLLALSIVSCSSDKETASLNKTFLENHNGVVWENDEWVEGSGEVRYLIFNNSAAFLTTVFYENGKECTNVYEGKNEWGEIVKINSNTAYELRVSFERNSSDDYITRFSVTNNGNKLELVESHYPDDVYKFTRRSVANPCL
jgi:hypothetical protein